MISGFEAVNSEGRVVLCNLLGLDLCQSSDGIKSGVLSQSQRNGLEGISETTESVLLNCLYLKNDK